jgi:hypothetical protein
MGRIQIDDSKKHKPISVSLPPHQHMFIKQNTIFDFSKFVQLHLQEYISKIKYIPIKNEKEVDNNERVK